MEIDISKNIERIDGGEEGSDPSASVFMNERGGARLLVDSKNKGQLCGPDGRHALEKSKAFERRERKNTLEVSMKCKEDICFILSTVVH